MKWVDCKTAMPPKGEEVVAWVIYQGKDHGTFTETWIDDDGWAMGSAKGFTVTHWMRVEEPSS